MRRVFPVLLLLSSLAHCQTPSQYDSLAARAFENSFELASLSIEIKTLEKRLNSSSFINRIVPTVNFSAFVGASGVVFIDQEKAGSGQYSPALRDWVGITISLPVNRAFDSNIRAILKLDLEAKRLAFSEAEKEVRHSLTKLLLEHARIAEQLNRAETEVQIREEVAQYSEFLFDLDRMDFDALAVKRLALQTAQSDLANVRHGLALIKLELERMVK